MCVQLYDSRSKFKGKINEYEYSFDQPNKDLRSCLLAESWTRSSQTSPRENASSLQTARSLWAAWM